MNSLRGSQEALNQPLQGHGKPSTPSVLRTTDRIQPPLTRLTRTIRHQLFSSVHLPPPGAARKRWGRGSSWTQRPTSLQEVSVLDSLHLPSSFRMAIKKAYSCQSYRSCHFKSIPHFKSILYTEAKGVFIWQISANMMRPASHSELPSFFRPTSGSLHWLQAKLRKSYLAQLWPSPHPSRVVLPSIHGTLQGSSCLSLLQMVLLLPGMLSLPLFTNLSGQCLLPGFPITQYIRSL